MAMKWFDWIRDLWHGEPVDETYTIEVPEGASVTVYSDPLVFPQVSQLLGGALMVSTGALSDRTETDIDELLQALDAALAQSSPDILCGTGTRLEDAFADDPPCTPVRAIIWVLNPIVFTAWSSGPRQLRRVIEKWEECVRQDILSTVYLQAPETVEGRAVGVALLDLGYTLRTPDEDNDDAIVYAIKRADGRVITCFTGEVLYPEGKLADWYASLQNESREDAVASLEALLRERLRPIHNDGPVAPHFARELRDLMLRISAGDENAYRELLATLPDREAGLVYRAHPKTNAARMVEWDNRHGIQVAPDWSVAAAVHRELEPDEPTCFAVIRPRELLEWMASEGAGVGIYLGDVDNIQNMVFVDPNAVPGIKPGGEPP